MKEATKYLFIVDGAYVHLTLDQARSIRHSPYLREKDRAYLQTMINHILLHYAVWG